MLWPGASSVGARDHQRLREGLCGVVDVLDLAQAMCAQACRQGSQSFCSGHPPSPAQPL